MTAMGHEDAFPRPRLSARCRFSHGTFAGTRSNGRDAPIPDFAETAVGLACKVFSRHSACGTDPPDREHVVARADRGMIHHEGSPRRGAQMCATPDGTLADPQ